MTWALHFWRSSIGGKVTMAVTGLLLFGFVVMHLLGNLQFFAAPEKINAYSKFLHDTGPMLWVARIGLLAIFVLHVATGIRLARDNRAARPVRYAVQATRTASWASRSMFLTGMTTLAFVVYHILHLTLGVVHPADAALRAGAFDGFDVHAMMKASFGNVGIVLAYVAAQVFLYFHLSHGVQSLAQTMGLHHARYTPFIRSFSHVLAFVIAGGNILIVTSVLFGFVR